EGPPRRGTSCVGRTTRVLPSRRCLEGTNPAIVELAVDTYNAASDLVDSPTGAACAQSCAGWAARLCESGVQGWWSADGEVDVAGVAVGEGGEGRDPGAAVLVDEAL